MTTRPLFPLRALASLLLTAPFLLLSLSACGDSSVSGRITDFESGIALAGARVIANQSGWGISDGSLVWDKAYLSETLSNSDGGFHLSYSPGGSANLLVQREGYQGYRHWYEDGSEIEIRLKRRLPDGLSLSASFLRFGKRRDGTFYGWNFGKGDIASAPEEADIFPIQMDDDNRGPLRLGTSGQGGLLFRSAEDLGVDGNFLIYADEAPAEGYLQELLLTFEGQGGLIFLRSRDGRNYAKIEFNPRAFSSRVAEDILRDLMLRYVYNPETSRALPFQE
jgi:hypothetical protein